MRSEEVNNHVESYTIVQAGEDHSRHSDGHAPVFVWVCGPDGNCNFLSRSWHEVTGQTPATALGMGWLEAIHADDRAALRAAHLTAIACRSHYKYECRARQRDGSYLWALVTAAPWHDRHGQFLGYIGTTVDITERKHAEDALREADRRKDEFIATLAHELRTPLAPIRTGLETMRLFADDRRIVDRTREIMERQVAQLARLIDDLMDVSRISTAKLHLTLARLDAATLIHNAVEATLPLIASRGHEMAIELPSEPVYIRADAVRMTQVLCNVLTNAAKYTPRRGRIRVQLTTDRGEAVIRITDNGRGIPADKQQSIFELFSQAGDRHDDLEVEDRGLGIGLHLVKRLMDLHEGRVRLASAGTNRGTTVDLWLPLAPHAASEDAAAAYVTPCAKRKVLVIDDNVDAAEAMSTYLALQGHDVVTAADGDSGISLARTFRPHMVLLDLRMPRKNGYEVAREIRAQPGGSEIVLAAVSGSGLESDMQATHQAGFDYHLVKPVDPGALQMLLSAPRPKPIRRESA